MILETIITTRNADGGDHVAPMGVHVHDDVFVLAPFKPSTTLDNLLRERCAVINCTDDVRVFAGCFIRRTENHPGWPLTPAVKVNAKRLTNALSHVEVEVVEVHNDEQRPRLSCKAVHRETHAPFTGFNRAQAAIIELAILVSRLHILPREKIEREIKYLQIAVDKTAGENEKTAWSWLMEEVEAHFSSESDTRFPHKSFPRRRESSTTNRAEGAQKTMTTTTKLLASVRSADEARTALTAPVDLLDLKEPSRGVLGALDAEVVREIVALCAGQRPISATVGDLPPDPKVIAAKVTELADAGVNYVKIGFFDATYLETCAGALTPLARRHQLIGVLFADRLHHFGGPTRLLKYAGFTGVMMDTADKSRGSVRTFTNDETLRQFVATARELSLLCGIAGSLTADDIEPLAALGADYLGFRTALCENGKRDGKICTEAITKAARKMGRLPVKAA